MRSKTTVPMNVLDELIDEVAGLQMAYGELEMTPNLTGEVERLHYEQLQVEKRKLSAEVVRLRACLKAIRDNAGDVCGSGRQEDKWYEVDADVFEANTTEGSGDE